MINVPYIKSGTFFRNKREEMKLNTRCLPLGTLPYDTVEATTRMAAKLFDKMPFIATIPNFSTEDNIINRTFENMPGVRIKDSNVKLKITSNHYKQGMSKLEKAFNHPDIKNLEPFAINAPFMEKCLQMVKKFKSPNVVINLLGPFTISQILTSAAEEQMLTDKTYRKLFIQSVCVKALWAIKKIKEINPDTIPIIILEEPLFGHLGDIKRENDDITTDLVIALFSRVIEKLKEAGAAVGIQCLDKCDWKIPINAGVDLISFDAYNNPNNLCIIPEKVIEFIARGGKINWGIIPVMNEAMVKSINIDYVEKRLFATMEGLILAGVPEKYVYNSAMVSTQGDLNSLSIIFAEKALILANQLSKRIPHK